MSTAVLVPRDASSGAVVTESESSRKGGCLEELIVQNTVNSAGMENLSATHRNTASVLDALHTVGSAGLRETANASRDNLNATYRAESSVKDQLSDLRSSLERTSGEGRLTTTILAGEIRSDLKDVLANVMKEGCETRERVLEDGCKTRHQESEHFGQIQLKAAENKASIEAKLAECCYEMKIMAMENSAKMTELIRSSETDRIRQENSDLKLNTKFLELKAKV